MAVGFRVADAYVEIHTEDDTRKGRQKIDRDTSRWANILGLKLGRIIGAGLLAGIGKAIIKAIALTAKLAAFGLVAGVVASAVGGLASAIAALIPLIAELVNVLIAASGALLLIPGAIAGIIAVVATAKLGLKGFGEALKAVGSGDAAVLAEALKKLAPQARTFVREIAKLKPAFDKMRLKIQNTLFMGLGRSMRDLGRLWIPLLTREVTGLARVLNGVVREVFEFLLRAQTRLDLARIFQATAVSVNNLRRGLQPILSILRDIAVVGAQVIASLTGGFGRALEGWAADIAELRASGGLEELIRDGLAAAKALVMLLGDIVGIIRSLVRAAGGAGGLFSFFDKLNRMLQSVEGQAVLKELFNDLDRIGRALIPVLLAILKALIPVVDGIAQIAEAFGPGLTVLAAALGNALGLLVGPIKSLEPLLFALARGLAPLAVILGTLVQAATPGLTAFLDAFVNALIMLVPVAPIVGKALGDLLIALAPLVELAGPALATLLIGLATGLSALARLFGPVVKLFATFAGQVLVKMLPLMIAMAERLLPLFAEQGQKILDAFAPLIPVLLEFVEIWLAQAAANLPIVIQAFTEMLPVIAQVAAIFVTAMLPALRELAPHLPVLVKAFSDLTLAFLDVLVALLPILPPLAKFFAEVAKAAVESGLLRQVVQLLVFWLTVATVVLHKIARATEVVVGWLTGARKAAQSFGSAVSGAINTAIGFFSRLGSVIRNAVGNLRTLLVEGGKNVIRGLLDGIGAMWESLKAKIRDAAQMIRDFWPFSPAKTGPLSGRGDLRFAGRNLVDRLTMGVSERLGAARASAADLAGLFGQMAPGVPGLAGVPTGSMAAAGRSSPASPPFGPYMLELDGRVVASFAIDAVTGAPQRVAAAADEGRRQRSFVSSARTGR